jgi:hypothetical protein
VDTAGAVADTADDPDVRRPICRRDFLVAAAAVATVRAAYGWGRVSFLHSPDEFAIGGMARYISGTADWNMFVASTWRPGYATVLAPLFWITSDPEWFVRLALIVNAVVAGWSAMFLARIGSSAPSSSCQSRPHSRRARTFGPRQQSHSRSWRQLGT